MMSNVFYTNPTRLERAYANYLLQTHFSGTFPISGRTAVSFLTKSHLPRLLLREIWNVVDPHQHGKLMELQQWWTLLKLVALAQQQQQAHPPNAVQELVQNVISMTATPLAVFANVVIPSSDTLLQQYSVEDGLDVMSLDVRSGGGAFSTRNVEWNTQNTPKQQPQDDEMCKAPMDFNVPKQTTCLSAALDELGAIEDMPLPSLGAALGGITTMQQVQENNNPDNQEDDFGDFTDAPPVVTTTNVEEEEQQQQVDSNDNDFGDLKAPATTTDTTTDSFGSFNQNATLATVPLSCALDELGSSHDMPLPSLSAAPVAKDENDNDDDDFGDFEAPEIPPITSNEEAATTITDSFGGFNQNTTPAIVPLSSALDELGSSHDVPLPSLSTVQQADNENDDDDDFGDFEAPEVPASTSVEEAAATADSFGGFNQNTTPAIVPLSSALDELGSSHDVPLPLLDTAPVADNDDDDDDFGDFEAPEIPPITSNEEAATTADSFGGFNQNTTLAIVPLSSALDELGSSHDMPLPSLSIAPVADDENDNDDFGDFEAPEIPPITSVEEAYSTADSFGGFNQNTTPAIVPLSSALDELGSSHDVPLPSLSTVQQADNENDYDDDDDFGEFEAPEVPAIASVEEASTADSFGGFNQNTTSAIVPLSSALDEVGSSHDVPLPSLSTAPAADNENDDDDDDDFGEFEAPVETKANEFYLQNETPAIVPLSMALDELGPTMDAPLPLLDAAVVASESNQNVDEEDENDEFGTFVAPPVESIEALGKIENELNNESFTRDEKDLFTGFKGGTVAAPVVPLSFALDELGSSHDAPLPSLGTFAVGSERKNDDDDDEDDFGDFEDAPNTNNEEQVESITIKEGDIVPGGPLPTLDSKDDDETDECFGFEAPKEATSLSSALDSLGAIQDAPLPPLGVPMQPQDDDDDDEFGDFEAPFGVQEADGDQLSLAQDALERPPECDTAEVQEAALDSLGLTQDAPLPFLGTESQSRKESDNEDNFGEFNDVPNGTESSNDPLTSAFAGFGGAEDKPLPSLESYAQHSATKESGVDADEFGLFEESPENEGNTGIEEAGSEHSNGLDSSEENEPSLDEPLPPADSQSPDLSPDRGDDVKAAPKEAKDISSATIDNDDPFSSAFDAIAPVENSPLPSFGMHKVGHEISPTEEHKDSQEDNFGSFEGPPAIEIAGSADKVQASNEDAEVLTISEPDSNFPGFKNSSDPFASAFDTIAPVEDAPLPVWGSGEMPTEDAANHVASTEDETHQSENDEDGFGSFEDATDENEDGVETEEPEQAEKVTKDGVYGQDNDLFSNSVAPMDEPLPTFYSASGSDFSGFETASENITSEENKSEVERLNNRDTDNFGDFSGVSRPSETGAEESNEAPPPDHTNSGYDDDDDDFGDFTAIKAPVEAVGDFDAEWGDFEEPSAVETFEGTLPNKVPTMTAATSAIPAPIQPESAANIQTATLESEVEDEFGDFGSFQEIEHPSTEKEETLDEIAIRVQEMQKSLTIQDSKGGLVDFIKMFRENIQVNKHSSGWRLGFNKTAQKTIDPSESLKRAQRCCQVMMLLTTSNKSSLNHWEKIFNVVRDELAMGSFLLEEANSIAGEKAVSSALGMWVAGLGEYVRVTRSIAATLCDLQCLDIDVDMTQMKNSMTLLDSVIDVEDLWTKVESASKGLKLAVPKLETVSDIRAKCLQRFSAENLCQLTLQPLSDEDNGTTKNPVEWSGRHFFACAANFWSNRVSIDVPL